MECRLPPLTKNIEGLRRHSLLLMLIPAVAPSEVLKWRGWLLHLLAKSARHYDKARNLVIAQVTSARTPNGVQFPIWDFAFEMEDCITSLYKAYQCITGLEKHEPAFAARAGEWLAEKKAVADIRNTQEHLYTRLPSGQTGKGPVLLLLEEPGDVIRLGSDRLPVVAIHKLTEHLFELVATQFPKFPADSAPEPGGVPHLSMEVALVEVAKVAAPDAAGRDTSTGHPADSDRPIRDAGP